VAERPYSKDDFDRGNEVAGIVRGGGFGKGTRIMDSRGRGAFSPPKSFSGEAAPKLNRLGKSTAPVEQIKPAEKKQMYDVERPFLREGDTPRRFQNGNKQSEGLTKEELGRIGDRNVQQMREKQARENEPPPRQPPDAAEIARRKARMEKFGVDPKRFGYRKGGAVRDPRDYGK
jgi:hypothetical protein